MAAAEHYNRAANGSGSYAQDARKRLVHLYAAGRGLSRDKAKAELSDKFDIREFHAQVLNTGALPLAILEQKIDRWIAAKKAS